LFEVSTKINSLKILLFEIIIYEKQIKGGFL